MGHSAVSDRVAVHRVDGVLRCSSSSFALARHGTALASAYCMRAVATILTLVLASPALAQGAATVADSPGHGRARVPVRIGLVAIAPDSSQMLARMLQDFILARESQLRACYMTEALRRDTLAQGRQSLFVRHRRGVVTSVEARAVAGRWSSGRSVERCVERAVRAWRFPLATDPEGTLSTTLTFSNAYQPSITSRAPAFDLLHPFPDVVRDVVAPWDTSNAKPPVTAPAASSPSSPPPPSAGAPPPPPRAAAPRSPASAAPPTRRA